MQEMQIQQLDEQKSIISAREKEEKRRQKKEAERMRIEQSSSYKLTKGIATLMDKWFLDPILGLIPGVGDALPSMFLLPSIYVSLFKIRSIPLTLAVIFNILKDILLGLIPFYIGNIIDFFNRAYIQNMRLIVGFVEDDQDVIDEINSKAVWSAILIVIFIALIWLMVRLVSQLAEWVIGLFS